MVAAPSDDLRPDARPGDAVGRPADQRPSARRRSQRDPGLRLPRPDPPLADAAHTHQRVHAARPGKQLNSIKITFTIFGAIFCAIF